MLAVVPSWSYQPGTGPKYLQYSFPKGLEEPARVGSYRILVPCTAWPWRCSAESSSTTLPLQCRCCLTILGSAFPSTVWFYRGLFDSDCWQTLQRKAFFVKEILSNEKMSKDRQCLCSNVGRSRCKLLQQRVGKAPLGISYPFGWEEKKRIKHCVWAGGKIFNVVDWKQQKGTQETLPHSFFADNYAINDSNKTRERILWAQTVFLMFTSS